MKNKVWIAALLLIVSNLFSYTQEDRTISFVFYNVENLFDTYDDIWTDDNEFTPDGEKKWNKKRYYSKLDNIARVLTGIGEWHLPQIVGLAEIENKKVLIDLAEHRLLKDQDYKIIHQDSPDERGIDVALLYNNKVFDPIHTSWIRIKFPFDSTLNTRDILYVSGRVHQLDTLHIFINHWPSRWGGQEATIPMRVYVASVMKKVTDSIFKSVIHPNILIAGDLNDNPTDSSVLKVLMPVPDLQDSLTYLVNPMMALHEDLDRGTLKYKGTWDVFDQIIYSTACLELEYSGLVLSGPFVYEADFLFTDDERYSGQKPFRTYAGPRYLGGFSDHLPVFIRFNMYELIDGVK